MRSALFMLTVLATLVVSASAQAGTYDVYSCRLPDGSPAPTNGWVPFTRDPVATANDSCGMGGALNASLTSPAIEGDAAGWTYTAPPATTVEGFEIFRMARAPGYYGSSTTGYVASFAWPPNDVGADADERCLSSVVVPYSCEQGLGTPGSVFDQLNKYERRSIRERQVTLAVGCWASFGPGGLCDGTTPPLAGLEMAVFAARMTLGDESAPTFERDDLAAQLGSADLRGVVRAAATVVDQGAGLSESALLVDGAEIERRSLDDLPGSCHQPFVEPVPCPLRRDLSLPFDSRRVANGAHLVQVAVYDAAGNRALSAPASVLVANPGTSSSPLPGPNGGHNATRFARLRAWFAGRSRKTYRTLAFGATTTIEGRLTSSAGKPIGGAELRVEYRDIGIASRPMKFASVTTDTKGRFKYRVVPGANRSLRFTYTAFPGDAGPVASAQVNLHVRAGVSLRASPTRVRNGTVLTFRGRVFGERGTRRAVVTIYALSSGPRKRIPVETVRAAASGKFTYRYRFRSIPGPVTYRFEARVLKQTGFPYVEGASRRIAIRGRP